MENHEEPREPVLDGELEACPHRELTVGFVVTTGGKDEAVLGHFRHFCVEPGSIVGPVGQHEGGGNGDSDGDGAFNQHDYWLAPSWRGRE